MFVFFHVLSYGVFLNVCVLAQYVWKEVRNLQIDMRNVPENWLHQYIHTNKYVTGNILFFLLPTQSARDDEWRDVKLLMMICCLFIHQHNQEGSQQSVSSLSGFNNTKNSSFHCFTTKELLRFEIMYMDGNKTRFGGKSTSSKLLMGEEVWLKKETRLSELLVARLLTGD